MTVGVVSVKDLTALCSTGLIWAERWKRWWHCSLDCHVHLTAVSNLQVYHRYPNMHPLFDHVYCNGHTKVFPLVAIDFLHCCWTDPGLQEQSSQ